MLVSEIATRVKRQFGDESGAQITDADILRWVNDAQREIAVNNSLLQTIATSSIVAGNSQFSLPPDLLTLHSVILEGRKLNEISSKDIEEYFADTSVGEPHSFWVWGSKLHLAPTPASSITNGLVLYYTRIPVAVTTVGDTPELSQQYHNRIVEYCIAQAMELDDNSQGHMAKMAQFEAGVAKLKDENEWRTREVYPTLTYVEEYD
jgi:hypothetical protein